MILRYVSTTSAQVMLEVFKGARRVSAAVGTARPGKNSIRWNGKVDGKEAPRGLYKLRLKATSGDQVATDRAAVRRTQIFDRWPTAGPAPVCGDRKGYDQVVTGLVDLSVIPDESYIYWHLRPSSHYPTLELRVSDVALPMCEDATALAGLFRALVRTCQRDTGTPGGSHRRAPARCRPGGRVGTAWTGPSST